MSLTLTEVTSAVVERSLKENSATRLPCVLVLDRSGSMQEYGKINKLNEGLQMYVNNLAAHELASKMVETAIVEFGPVNVRTPFTTADDFIAPTLTADGSTPLGAAVLRAIDLVEERVLAYKAHGIQSYRPWIILITDGMPDSGDPIDAAIAAVQRGVAAKKFVFNAVGVGNQGTDFEMLRRLSPDAKALSGLKFTDLFQWLSTTFVDRATSVPGQRVAFAPTTWAEEVL